MKRSIVIPTTLPLIAAMAAPMLLTAPSQGQSLSDRINYVRQQRARAQANNTSKGQLLGTLLYTDLTVRFDATPARDVFEYLQTVLGIPIVGRYNDDRAGIGIDPETPITLDVVDSPALTVLELALEQCADFEDTTWQLRRGFVEIGTKGRLSARGAQEIRYYPIQDLLFEAPNFDNSPDLDIGSALNQGQGGGSGGGGGGGGFGGGGGGGGGSGGGGGGSGGGGGIFGDPDDEPDRLSDAEKADQIIQIITESVEPEEWVDNGGDAATIRYYQGVLIIRAPDYIHRQIGGYPFPIRPLRSGGIASAPPADQRYIAFTSGLSDIRINRRPQAPPNGSDNDGGTANASR